ncbi:MAG: molybdopterin-synthase adenylyltransferase MoeB [Gemmatimonadales bacterium]|jgi:molybdopterin/thiamine biosynthesis adenylyltransferase/rhodanese-related sulfurtransferase|nr:MAG: molybdopterin-synthase adenylyltransferase MoeB [Gemmatimonadales bacterium]
MAEQLHPELPPLSAAEFQRYSRHLILPHVGEAGQRRLKQARVLVVGAGGLGSPAALYLAAAGVGTIGLVDADLVDVSNLQRQVLHGTSTLGLPKLDSARARIHDLNPLVTVEKFPERLTSKNALDIFDGFEVVLDGSDNFPTRYLINDAAYLSGIPDIYGAIFQFEGQASVFAAKYGPCYRCLYAEPPPPGMVPGCAEAGVLGALPGVIGSLQAMEAIKLLLGIGEPLVGRLMLFDALRLQFRELALQRDPACPLCGESPTIRELIDYDAFCGMVPVAVPAGLEVTPAELQRELAAGRPIVLVDVREVPEWELVRLEGARLTPLSRLPGLANTLDPAAEIVAYCHHGVRSLQAASFLRSVGLPNVRSLAGGLERWAQEIDREMVRY